MGASSAELTGIVASEGQALGTAYILDTVASSVPHRGLMPQEVGPELARFRAAVDASRIQMQKLIGAGNLGHELETIFEVQLLLLEDPMLIDETREKIRSRNMNAEWALAEEAASLKEFLLKARNAVFRERAADLEDMSNRILSNLMGVPDGDVRIPGLKNLPEGSIVVAHDLSPSLMLHIRKNCAGIVTEEGGVTGHMAILAKSRGIPALVHVPQLMKLVRAGDVLLLDATEGSGRLLLHPSNAEVEAFHVYTRALPGPSSVPAHSPIALPDGSEARIWLNLDDLPDEADEEDDVQKLEVTGVSGVGLFRTEFLYLKDPTLLIQPDRHTECYYRLFTGPLNGLPLTLRLLDMGDDKGYPPQSAVKDRDLRGVRFLLANPTILDSQLRAIFTAVARAGLVDNQCRLMVPVVSRFEEMEAMRECVMRLREEIERDSGTRLPEVPLGMMLETPAAALMCEIFASNSAFFSIGSNDLTRLALGVDRDNTLPRDELFYQPALFRMIELVRSRITVPLAVCGEIAGRPDVLSILIGLGVRDFSVAPASLARCFERLAGFDADSFARCHDQARRVCQAHTAADVRALVSS